MKKDPGSLLDRLLLKVRKESFQERPEPLKYHDKNKEIGDRYVFSDLSNNPEGKIYAIVRNFRNIQAGPGFVQSHSHTNDSLWMFIGDNDDLSGLEVEIEIEGVTRQLRSPASVYLPANLKHSYRPLRGSGKYLNLVLAEGGDYNASLAGENTEQP